MRPARWGAAGLSWSQERWAVGFGMVARDEVALVTATLEIEQGHMAHQIFIVLVFTTIVVSVFGPSHMVPFAQRLGSAPSPRVQR